MGSWFSLGSEGLVQEGVRSEVSGSAALCSDVLLTVDTRWWRRRSAQPVLHLQVNVPLERVLSNHCSSAIPVGPARARPHSSGS